MSIKKDYLQKMYVTLVNSDRKSFKNGDIITNGKEIKIATSPSGFFNFKNWGYIRKDLIIVSISNINTGQLSIASNNTNGKIIDFEGCSVKPAISDYAPSVYVLKVEASTGHESHNIPKIKKDFIKLFLSREGGIKVTNVVSFKDNNKKIIPILTIDGTVITKPLFKKFKHRHK